MRQELGKRMRMEQGMAEDAGLVVGCGCGEVADAGRDG